MATAVGPQGRLVTNEHDAALARNVLRSLEGPLGYLSVERPDVAAQPLPPELGQLLQQVLQAVASRPTLMKMIGDGGIPAHKVGTHTRLLSEDVIAAKKARRARERAAFAALLEA